MSKPEWGIKRTCPSCATKFYDFKKSPIVCPKCGATVEPDFAIKTRRGRATNQAESVLDPKIVPLANLAADGDGDDILVSDLDVDLVDDEVEDDELIEDTSDLGEDDDDMAEVIEHVDKDEEV